MKKRVVIIGASSGIGRALAEYYASGGCKVGIAARREEALKEVASAFPHTIVYRVADVTKESSSIVLAELIEETGGADLIIFCSGAGRYSETLNFENEHHTTDVNVNGFLNIMVPAFNYFVDRASRVSSGSEAKATEKPQLVTISSVASIRGLAPTPSYSATKRFQTIYFEALEQKAHKIGLEISFTSIIPGFIATDFINRKYPFTMQLAYAVKRITRAIEKRKRVAVIDWRWRIIVFIMRLIPSCLWQRLPI